MDVTKTLESQTLGEKSFNPIGQLKKITQRSIDKKPLKRNKKTKKKNLKYQLNENLVLEANK